MRALLVVMALSVGSCDALRIEDSTTVNPITTDVRKIYEKDPSYINGEDYASITEFRKVFDDKIVPELVVVSSSNCAHCFLLHQRIKKEGLQEEVTMLNIKEQWVHNVMQAKIDIKELPVLLVVWNDHPEMLLKKYEASNIIKNIKIWVRRKNPQ